MKFLRQGLLQADFLNADAVSLYLLPSVNLKLWRQLKPGARVVSHDFGMGPEWPPVKTLKVKGATIYRWTITGNEYNAGR